MEGPKQRGGSSNQFLNLKPRGKGGQNLEFKYWDLGGQCPDPYIIKYSYKSILYFLLSPSIFYKFVRPNYAMFSPFCDFSFIFCDYNNFKARLISKGGHGIQKISSKERFKELYT